MPGLTFKATAFEAAHLDDGLYVAVYKGSELVTPKGYPASARHRFHVYDDGEAIEMDKIAWGKDTADGSPSIPMGPKSTTGKLFAAIKGEPLEVDEEIDPDDYIGKKLQVLVRNVDNDGKPANSNIAEFMATKKAKAPKAETKTEETE